MVSRNFGKAYEAPESEVLVFQVERNFLGESQLDYSGNYHLEDGGLGDGGNI